ncbi:MAG: fucose permease [Polaribacter sp.]|jgi:fucose permease
MSLFNELKRRNVFKVAAAYAIVSWLILQVTGSIVPIIEAPDWVAKAILVLLLAGFPIALLFAWAFEMAHEGIKKESEVVRDDSITSDAELLIPQPP